MARLTAKANDKYNRWTFIEKKVSDDGRQIGWICRCDCGTERLIKTPNTILHGKSQSCGCFKSEFFSENNPMYREDIVDKVRKSMKADPNRPEILKRAVEASKSEQTKAKRKSTNQFKYGGVAPIVYLVAGVSGAGKSWVCEQLTDKFKYVSYDSNRKSKHLELLKEPSDKPILYDPPIKISTFIKRHSNDFDIRSVFIIEDEATIKARLAQRGGVFTESAKKRIIAILNRSKKYGIFSGTSSEVLLYLKDIVKE